MEEKCLKMPSSAFAGCEMSRVQLVTVCRPSQPKTQRPCRRWRCSGRIKQRYANRHSLRPREKDLKKTPGAWVLRWKKLSQCPCLSSNSSDSRNEPFDDHCSPISLILLYIDKLCGGLRTFV